MATSRFPAPFGKYTLLRPLARGGMGQIYLAAHGDVEGAEKLCVLKKLVEGNQNPQLAARFLDEAKVVVRLNHGNLVNVFDAGQVDDELYLAMELVEGRDLRATWNKLAEKQRRVPVEVALLIAREVCRGLSYAHGYGGLNLVHRDVAPPNVLLSWQGEVKLTDFGLAASTLKSEHTAPGIVFGRLAYLAPEQALGEEADVRSDLWAVALILWELLTGRPLHTPEADQKILLQKVRQPRVEAPSKWNPLVPASLDAVLLRALTVDRGGRYQRADDLREALARELGAIAPTVDGSALAQLLRELWGDEIDREGVERERLLRDALKSSPREATQPFSARKSASVVGRASTQSRSPTVRPPALGGRPTPAAVTPPLQPGVQMLRRSTSPSGSHPNSLEETQVSPPPRSPSRVAVAPAPMLMQEPDANAYLGQVIDARYRVERVLGQGGMGWVYEVEHVEIGKRLALKVLLPQFSRQADLVARFRREARAASTIGHPNIVDVTDSGTTSDGSFYFVMERLDGIELGDVLRNERRVLPERAVHIGAQMCKALAAAHAAGIIHRDLKPENVFLITRESDADFVKILDFGIAKSPEVSGPRKLTTPGLAMGTPEYMAPEQAAGRAADPRVDVYSVGAILYEMVTGWPPHSGDNVMEILTKKATEPPKPISELNPDVPETLQRVILSCLDRDPELRPQSMGALEYQLNKSLKGRGQAVAAVLGLKSGGDTGWSGEWSNTDGRLFTPAVVPSVRNRPPTAPPVAQPLAPSPDVAAAGAEVAPIAPSPSPSPLPSHRGSGRGRWAGLAFGLAFLGGGVYLASRYYQPFHPPAVPAAGGPKTEQPIVKPATPVVPDDPGTSVVTPEPPKREDIGALLEWARRAADGNRLVKPPGDNMKELLDRIAAADPGNADAKAIEERVVGQVRARAQLKLKKRRLDEAEADFRALMALRPDDATVKGRLAGTLALRARTLLGKGRAAASIADATAAVELLPDDPSLRLVLGDGYLAAGRREQAADEYRKVIEAQPGNKRAQKKLQLALKPVGKKRRR